jgi:hypothetical protein
MIKVNIKIKDDKYLGIEGVREERRSRGNRTAGSGLNKED